MGCFPIDYEFLVALSKSFIRVLSENGFCNAKFPEFSGSWGWGDHHLTKPLRNTCLADFTRLQP